MKTGAPNGAKMIIERLREAGYEAYAVGGCVRDAVLGRQPEDWDITTSALPERVTELFSDLRVVPTGIKHGTVTVLADGESFEVTTYRVDGEYSDHRRPESVRFTASLEEDLARRDFTINAMAWDPFTDEIVDPFGGMRDIEDRTVRCVGEPEKRFSEDALRVLRALRFSSVLDFEIEEKTARAVREMAGDLEKIAGERIRAELVKLITGRGAARVLLEYREVFAVILPELEPLMGLEMHDRFEYFDAYERTASALESYRGGDPVTAAAILLRNVGVPTGTNGEKLAREALYRLRYPLDEIKKISELVKYSGEYILHTKKAVRRLASALGYEQVSRLLELKRADALAMCEAERARPWADVDGISRIFEEVKLEGEPPSLKNLAVSGGDIMALGVPKGKRVGEILSSLLDAVIDEECENEKEALIERAREML
ncbi:MAG: CCA tRNA nucleotidyltransferase [Oscillospiraceae bacterium]|nr:CCA tRNA nucleotidyltransferase [Oscillospiraceae bacterium]